MPLTMKTGIFGETTCRRPCPSKRISQKAVYSQPGREALRPDGSKFPFQPKMKSKKSGILENP